MNGLAAVTTYSMPPNPAPNPVLGDPVAVRIPRFLPVTPNRSACRRGA